MLEPADDALAAAVVALLAAGPGEREEARDVEAVAVAVDGEPARLEVAVAVRLVAAAAGEVDVADDRAGAAASMTVIVSWPLLATKTRRPSGETTTFHGSAPVVSAPARAGAERARRARVRDPDDADRAARGVGDERVAVGRVERDALRLVADADRPQDRVVRGADDRDRVGARVDDPDEAAVARHRDRARVGRGRERAARLGGADRRVGGRREGGRHGRGGDAERGGGRSAFAGAASSGRRVGEGRDGEPAEDHGDGSDETAGAPLVRAHARPFRSPGATRTPRFPTSPPPLSGQGKCSRLRSGASRAAEASCPGRPYLRSARVVVVAGAHPPGCIAAIRADRSCYEGAGQNLWRPATAGAPTRCRRAP